MANCCTPMRQPGYSTARLSSPLNPSHQKLEISRFYYPALTKYKRSAASVVTNSAHRRVLWTPMSENFTDTHLLQRGETPMTTHTISSCLRMSPALLAGLRGKMSVIFKRRAFFHQTSEPPHCREAAARPALARGNLFQLWTQDYERQNR